MKTWFIVMACMPLYGVCKQENTVKEVVGMRFSFKPLSKDDLPILYQWFEQPHVIEWWPAPKKGEEFFEHFLKRIRSKDTVPFLVLLDDKTLGYIHYYSISSEMRRWLPPLPEHSVGIDQFIGESENLGKGYGPAFVKAF